VAVIGESPFLNQGSWARKSPAKRRRIQVAGDGGVGNGLYTIGTASLPSGERRPVGFKAGFCLLSSSLNLN
jgi:hypothetical protein